MHEREQKALRLLRAALPGVTIAAADRGTADVLVALGDGSAVAAELRWVQGGFPRDVDRVMARPAAAPVILVAEQLSVGARARAEARGVSWVDGTGGAWIRLGGIYVEREGTPTAPAAPPRRESGWARATREVAEAIVSQWELDRRSHVGDVRSLAATTGRSLGAVSSALQMLEREGYLRRGGSRGRGPSRSIVDVSALLHAWAEQERMIDRPVAMRSAHPDAESTVHSLLRAFDDRAAIGGAFAATELAPVLTLDGAIVCHVDASLGADRHPLLAAAGVGALTSGLTVVVRAAPPVTLALASDHDGMRFVAPARVYADLIAAGGRAIDVAEALVDRVWTPR